MAVRRMTLLLIPLWAHNGAQDELALAASRGSLSASHSCAGAACVDMHPHHGTTNEQANERMNKPTKALAQLDAMGCGILLYIYAQCGEGVILRRRKATPCS